MKKTPKYAIPHRPHWSTVPGGVYSINTLKINFLPFSQSLKMFLSPQQRTDVTRHRRPQFCIHGVQLATGHLCMREHSRGQRVACPHTGYIKVPSWFATRQVSSLAVFLSHSGWLLRCLPLESRSLPGIVQFLWFPWAGIFWFPIIGHCLFY